MCIFEGLLIMRLQVRKIMNAYYSEYWKEAEGMLRILQGISEGTCTKLRTDLTESRS